MVPDWGDRCVTEWWGFVDTNRCVRVCAASFLSSHFGGREEGEGP